VLERENPIKRLTKYSIFGRVHKKNMGRGVSTSQDTFRRKKSFMKKVVG